VITKKGTAGNMEAYGTGGGVGRETRRKCEIKRGEEVVIGKCPNGIEKKKKKRGAASCDMKAESR